jgi:hypothetical protein
MRKLRFMWKDRNSVGGSCPALYEVEDGYVVQGLKLTAAEQAQLLNRADNEDGVFVPKNVLDRLRDQL